MADVAIATAEPGLTLREKLEGWSLIFTSAQALELMGHTRVHHGFCTKLFQIDVQYDVEFGSAHLLSDIKKI